MVPAATPHAHRQPNQTTGGLPDLSTTSTHSQPTPGRLGHLREHWKTKGLSIEASSLIAKSLRSRTEKQYESAWNSWTGWCNQQTTNPLSPAIADIVNFLAHEHSVGKSYSTLNVYRSALSSTVPLIDGHAAGQHPLVVRLLKGVFNVTPPKPKYNQMWNVSTVLDHIISLPQNSELSLLSLSKKLLALFALVSAQRTQTLANIDLKYLNFWMIVVLYR